MGLEFDYNVFIHLKGGDRLPGVEQLPATGCITGRKGNFLHFAGQAKWAGFDIAREVCMNVHALPHSFGFVSLRADYLDCNDRDRAYVLNGGRFCEVNTRTVLCREDTPPGLYEHFAWFRGALSFEERSPPDRAADLEQTVTVAGWLRGTGVVPGLPPSSHLIGETSCSLSYVSHRCLGEEDVTLKDVLLPMLDESKEWGTDGMLFILGGPTIPQIAVSGGECFPLAPLEPSEWTYHSTPAWTTGHSGYDKR
jgi:hypothetical protein